MTVRLGKLAVFVVVFWDVTTDTVGELANIKWAKAVAKPRTSAAKGRLLL